MLRDIALVGDGKVGREADASEATWRATLPPMRSQQQQEQQQQQQQWRGDSSRRFLGVWRHWSHFVAVIAAHHGG